MDLLLIREPTKDEATLGSLYIDKVWFSWTLEDAIRNTKIFGQTAIPQGVYTIGMSYSEHFKKTLPILYDVPNFEGVRIHPGNEIKDTEGCILVGTDRYAKTIGRSVLAFDKLFKLMKNADSIQIQILQL